MNLQNGFERVSAVWWGFWGLLALAVLAAAILIPWASDRGVLAGLGLAGIVAAYVAHRITCWVIAGFFAPRS